MHRFLSFLFNGKYTYFFVILNSFVNELSIKNCMKNRYADFVGIIYPWSDCYMR